MKLLEIKNLKVKAGEKIILNDLSFSINEGESLVIMGPNGSGKSTLAQVLMGSPAYQVESGQIIFKGEDISSLSPEERAAKGIFLAFQEPREIKGIELFPFLFDSYKAKQVARGEKGDSVFAFKGKLDEEMEKLRIKDDWSERELNQDFSGGEKKKAELLQLALAEPDLAVLDEIDSGLDVDALALAGEAIKRFKETGKSLLAITHYQRLLDYIAPDRIIVMAKGKIVKDGGPELAKKLEDEGFASLDN